MWTGCRQSGVEDRYDGEVAGLRPWASTSMFFILRAGLVIGLIFYLSPLRLNGGLSLDSLVASAVDAVTPGEPARPPVPEAPANPLPSTVAEAERLWRNLPPEARQAVLDRLRAKAASSLQDAVATVQAPRPQGTAPPQEAATMPGARPQGADTLRTDDRRPAWRGETQRP